MSECLETPTAHVWRENVSSQTVVECWSRDKQRTRTFVGRRPERLTDSDSDAHVFQESLFATFVEWSHRFDEGTWSVHSLRPGGGGDGNVERAVDVSPNEMEG